MSKSCVTVLSVVHQGLPKQKVAINFGVVFTGPLCDRVTPSSDFKPNNPKPATQNLHSGTNNRREQQDQLNEFKDRYNNMRHHHAPNGETLSEHTNHPTAPKPGVRRELCLDS